MFPVLNMADQDITVREISGTNQTIDILNKEKGLVAMTLSDGIPPLKYIALPKSGSERLLISGQKEYVLDLKQLGNVGSFPGLYVHKEGQDWKALVNGQDSNKKTFHFAAVDISGESIVTVEETAITKLKFDILKGSIIQGGISSYGISAPFQLKATVKGKNEDLFINGEKMLYANTSKDSSDILNIVVHKQGQDWRAETAGGSLKLTDFMVTQFIVMNMFNKDITVEETSSGQIIDVQKSEMLQLARPTSGRKEAFKFKAILKDSSKKVLVNGQDPFSLDPSDITMMNILVVHEEGQNWQQIQSSLLQTGSGSTGSPAELMVNMTHTGSADSTTGAPLQADATIPKYNLQITAVNMLLNQTVVLEEISDRDEKVDIPGNATATLGLLISGRTQPLRFKAVIKGTAVEMYLNGKKELSIDPQIATGLESIIVIGKQGILWEPTRFSTLQLIGKGNVGLTEITDPSMPFVGESSRSLQLKIVNKASTVVLFEEISNTGQKLDVPTDATATLGFLIRDRQEPLKFKAYENGTGVEMLLNGQKILPVDVDSTGIDTIIVVHREGFDYPSTRKDESQRLAVSSNDGTTQDQAQSTGSIQNGHLGIPSAQPVDSQISSTGTDVSTQQNMASSTGSTNEASPAIGSQTGAISGSIPSANSGSVINSVNQAPNADSRTQTGNLLKNEEHVEFTIASGVDGFAFLEETSGTGQKIELPTKNAQVDLSIETKGRFAPLTFKASSREGGQRLFVNGKEELDVALEAVSPYWLIVHKQGDDWEAIKSAIQKSGGLTVDSSQKGVTSIHSSSIPAQLKMLPIAFNNIATKDAEISEVTGTMYKTIADASKMGMFVLPATPIGRLKPVELRAKIKGTDQSLLINGEELYSLNLNAADITLIVHNEGQNWDAAMKTFQQTSKTLFGNVAGSVLGNFGGANSPISGSSASGDASSQESKTNSGMISPVDAAMDAIGTGKLVTGALNAANIGIKNSAGIEVELRLNGQQYKNLPVAATGAITLTSSQGVENKLEAVEVATGQSLLLNNEKSLTVDNTNKPTSIVITKDDDSITLADGSHVASKYGKVNFMNRADKDVKIYEISGIGEPTVLSPNYVSTFFLKSPKDAAVFRAVDPITNEAYLLNGQTILEVSLDQNPTRQTEVQVSRPIPMKRTPEKRPSTCLALSERGPCYSALQYETQVEAAEGKSETCKKYLEEIISKCALKNASQGIDECKNLCNSKDSDLCERIWGPKSCSSSNVRYSFNPETLACQALDYNGCLGNANNFATPDECAKMCMPEHEINKPKRNSLEKRMKSILQKHRLLRPLRHELSAHQLISHVLPY